MSKKPKNPRWEIKQIQKNSLIQTALYKLIHDDGLSVEFEGFGIGFEANETIHLKKGNTITGEIDTNKAPNYIIEKLKEIAD